MVFSHGRVRLSQKALMGGMGGSHSWEVEALMLFAMGSCCRGRLSWGSHDGKTLWEALPRAQS